MLERFDRKDIRFLIICGVVFAVCLAIGLIYFGAAFPEASIEFRYDRAGSRELAQAFLQRLGEQPETQSKQASKFSWDDRAKVFLERTIGLSVANERTREEIKVWFWRHRWFTPLQVEQIVVDVSPAGEIVGYEHRLPEEAEAPPLAPDGGIPIAEAFLRSIGIQPETLSLVSRSERKLPRRTDTVLTWERKGANIEGAPYRFSVTLQGSRVGAYREWLEVPESWTRSYRELRSRNEAAGAVDSAFLLITIVAALVIFIIQLRRGNIHLRFTLWSGAIGGILIVLVALNSWPTALANYNTTRSWTAFLVQQIGGALLQGVAVGLFLMVIVGAGDVLYRQRLPNQLAIPRLLNRLSLRSKRVFLSFILGYTLFAAFLAYQVIFYLVADSLGAWAPAQIPYDEILNTAIPWVTVLFIGFFPAMSEEYMSRAFSLPFFERILRSRIASIVIAGMIWGFGHAAYPNQPFFIRGLEVGIAGIVIGLLMYRFGLLPLLIWHYTVDALYTSLLLFQSNNTYYIVTAAIGSLCFLLPLLISLALYIRHRGFRPDEELSNASIPVSEPPPANEEEVVAATLPEPRATRGWQWALLVLAGAAAAAFFVLDKPSLGEVVDYAMPPGQAAEAARAHLEERAIPIPKKELALPVSGFRSWDETASREDGGSPGDYSTIAAEYLLRHADQPIRTLVEVQRDGVDAATWMLRLFTPEQKEEVRLEINPRTRRVVGFHRYLHEDAEGEELDQTEAEAIASSNFAHYQLSRNEFDLKEALSYQQPNRRDWLFHYQEKKPIAAEAFRRVSVRVAGSDVSQFAKTIKIPEKAEIEATQETVINSLLFLAKILSILALLAVFIAGVIAELRRSRFRWKRPLRIALLLILPILATAALGWDAVLAQYDTSIAWQTFLVVAGTSIVLLVLVQAGMAFVSLAAIETAVPGYSALLRREGRERLGREAALLALGALLLLSAVDGLTRLFPRWFPDLAALSPLTVSDLVARPASAMIVMWQAAFVALLISAAAIAFRSLEAMIPETSRRWLRGFTGVLLVLALMDASVRPEQLVLGFVEAVLTAAVIFFIAFHLLRGNPLAYPLTVFVLAMVVQISTLAGHDRIDLRTNAAILAVVLIGVLLWFAVPGIRRGDLRRDQGEPFVPFR
ncbi:MAG TPA: type II CAAX endopeptidase family protein [Thermoanaerobaculia bacterium]|nr:type II CAAX endopeptidase family protein [Thermoanaerobaculia bacterium]